MKDHVFFPLRLCSRQIRRCDENAAFPHSFSIEPAVVHPRQLLTHLAPTFAADLSGAWGWTWLNVMVVAVCITPGLQIMCLADLAAMQHSKLHDSMPPVSPFNYKGPLLHNSYATPPGYIAASDLVWTQPNYIICVTHFYVFGFNYCPSDLGVSECRSTGLLPVRLLSGLWPTARCTPAVQLRSSSTGAARSPDLMLQRLSPRKTEEIVRWQP